MAEQARPYGTAIFDVMYDKPALLVPPSLTGEVRERVDFRGDVLVPLDEAALRATLRGLKAQDDRSRSPYAFCSRFFIPQHEARVREIANEEMPGCNVSLSAEILPQIREYYRLSTTVINAYLQPILARYVANLDRRLAERRRRHAAEIHHAVERRHVDVRGSRAHGGDDGAVRARRRRHRRRRGQPHAAASPISSPSTWAARPATWR